MERVDRQRLLPCEKPCCRLMFAPEAVVVVVEAGVVVVALVVSVELVVSVVLGLVAVLVLFGLARFTEGMIARRFRFEGRPADLHRTCRVNGCVCVVVDLPLYKFPTCFLLCLCVCVFVFPFVVFTSNKVPRAQRN